MLAHLATTKLIYLGDETVEELTVVAHDDDGAVELADGLLEYILGSHIEMVGGLVEDEKVDLLEQKFDHGQTAAFTTREYLDLLVGCLATKHEGSEDIAYLETDVAYGYTIDGVKHGELFIE